MLFSTRLCRKPHALVLAAAHFMTSHRAVVSLDLDYTQKEVVEDVLSTLGVDFELGEDDHECSLDGVECSENSTVTELRFRGKILEGSISTMIGLLKDMNSVDLYANFVGGTLPSEIGMLDSLRYLSIRNNLGLFKLSHNSNIGTNLPSEIGELEDLEVLDVLRFNSITGTLPSEIGELEDLEVLVLGYNSFTGTIPTEIGKLSNLETLDVESNGFTPPVPSEIGLLRNLREIYMDCDLCETLPDGLECLNDDDWYDDWWLEISSFIVIPYVFFYWAIVICSSCIGSFV